MYTVFVLDLSMINYAVKQRRFYIVGEINEMLMTNAIEFMIQCKAAKIRTKKVTFYLNTAGGSVPDAFAFCDMLRSMPYEVECICMGEVCSSGIFIVSSCDKRRSLPNTSFLWHGLSWSGDGSSPKDMQQDSQHFANYSKKAETFLRECTGNQKIMQDLGPRSWFDVAKAQTMGILNG